MATSFIIASKTTTAGPAADRSYDQIETLRARRELLCRVRLITATTRSSSSAAPSRSWTRASDDFQTLRGTMRGGYHSCPV